MKVTIFRYWLLTAVFFMGLSSPAWAGEPTDQIRSAINQGVEILSQAKLDNQKKRAEVIDQLRRVVYPLFDFEEMAKRSLGSHWRRLDPQQQKEFTAAFTELLEKTYADRIDLYEGQKVVYTGETIDGDYAEVRTRVMGKKDQNYSVNYKLRKVQDKWQIYDIVAENISLVNNYRSQFQRIIVNSSFEDLMKRVKEKGA